MATSFTLLIVGLYLSLTIIYNGGTETMDSQLFASLITVGAAMAGSIIADIVVIRKENSNSKLLSKEHEGLSKEHDSLSKEHDNLSKEHTNLSEKSTVEHEHLREKIISLSKEHDGLANDISDIRDYVLESKGEKECAERNGINLGEVMAQIRSLAAVSQSSEQKVVEMKDKIDKYELLFQKKENETQYLQQQIEDLRSENKRLVDENQKLKRALYQFRHPDLDEPEL